MKHWLLETELFGKDSQAFVEALEKVGVKYEVCKFGRSYIDYVTASIANNHPTVFHGSLQLGKLLKTHSVSGRSKIEVYCNLPKLECLYYYPKFGEYLLNSQYVMLPFGELARRKNWLFDKIGNGNNLFIRPSSTSKTFTGTVALSQNWDAEVKKLSLKNDPQTLVIVAPAVAVHWEWRLVVANNKIVTASQYNDRGLRIKGAPTNVLEYAQDVLKNVNYNPDPIWTLDVCETDKKELKVLEVGSFSCAGLYACDYEAIIKAVEEI